MSQTPIHDNAELGTAMEEWQAFTATLSEAGVAVHQRADPDRTAAEQEQITTALLWTLLAAVAALPQMSRDYPEFVPILNPSVRRIAANVDTIYSVASIRGTGTYRITGRRGTVRIVHLQVVGGSLGTNEKITVLADINLDTCRIDERGWVDIILSPERPDGCEGDWYPLDPSLDAAFVTLRQISYDWLNEIDAQLSIHRVDQPAGRPADTPGAVLSNMRLVAEYVAKEPLRFMDVQERQLASLPVNGLIEATESLPGTIGGQAYSHGLIQIAANEAWIAEWEPPAGSPYWGVQLLDYFYNTLDVMRTQASLNGHLAAVDDDGKIRVVVSAADPGLQNWLDMGPHERVQIRFRFYGAKHPPISTRVVPLTELLESLPRNTATVTPEQRSEALRNRAIGLQLRRRW